MIRRVVTPLVVALGVLSPAAARAQTPAPSPEPAAAPSPVNDDVARAETAFNEARELRDAGRYAEACPLFAESRRLAPGIGVTLHLADCYEKTGKIQSAWTEFRNAEKLARERDDKRADVAEARAQALESKVNRVTLTLPLAAGQTPPEVTFDGVAVSADHLNTAMPVDPGEHVVTVAAAGRPVRSLSIHVDSSMLATTVPLDEAPVAAAPPAPPVAPEAATAPVEVGDPGAARRWTGFGLIAAGVAGGAVATWLVTSKVTYYMADGQPCDSRLRSGAVPEAAVLYTVGGLAVASGIVLVVTAPKRKEVAVLPLLLPGGGGAFMSGTF